jgi:hypothetical protein
MSTQAETEKHSKQVTIEVNTRSFEVPSGKLSFDDVVNLAYPPKPGQPRIACTVTYHNKHESTDHKLSAGESVEVREGMVFVVSPTNES